MRLKSSKKRQPSSLTPLPCTFCLTSRAGQSLTTLSLHTLTSKYFQPQLESYHYRKISHILFDQLSGGSTQLKQAKIESQNEERMHQCYRFGQIVERISGVVRHRVDVDHNKTVHFKGILYNIIKKYITNTKRLHAKKKQLSATSQHIQNNVSEQPLLKLYIQRRVLKDLDSFYLGKDNNETNESTVDLRILRNNIEEMIKKITNLSVIRAEIGKGKKSTKKEVEKVVLKQFQGISVIKKKEDEGKQKDKNQVKEQQESYGLERVKSKRLNNKLKKMTTKSIDHLAVASPLSFPQTPKTHLLSTSNAFSYSNKSLKTLSMRSRDSSNTLNSSPASPSVHKSVTLGLSQTLSSKGRAGRKKR